MTTSLSDSFENSSEIIKQNTEQTENNTETEVKAHSVWKKFIELLSDSLKAGEVNTWFSVIIPKSFENNILTITVPSEDYYSLIESRYNKIISKIVDSLLGAGGKLNYEITQMGLFGNLNSEKTNPSAEANSTPHLEIIKDNLYGNIKVPELDIEEEFNSNLNQKHIFDNFIKGESNELAVAAAYAITNNPGKTYNPFFVYGGVGLGKTHLVQAIGNEIYKKFPDKKIYYTTAPDFTTQFTTNIAQSRIDFSSNRYGTKKLDSFYKSLDVLILDDIQYLSGKEKNSGLYVSDI